MNSGVKFSIVGCGRIGSRHAEHITNQAELIAVCDIDENALKKMKDKYPDVKLYDNIDSMLDDDKDSQVVNICTPNGLHAQHTIKALKKGKHVVCEKPMALTVKDANRMNEAAKNGKKHLFIVKQNRFNPPVQELRKAIDEGRIGKIYSVQLNCFWNRNERYYEESPWKGTKNLDGGILFTQFSHFIDLLYWFVGDVKDVEVISKNYNHKGSIEFEDTLVAVMEFASGAVATMNCTVNSFQKNMEGSLTIFGEKGTVKIGGQYLNVLEYQSIENYIIDKIESKLIFPLTGTPITGFVVCDAMAPGNAAAKPAIPIKTSASLCSTTLWTTSGVR